MEPSVQTITARARMQVENVKPVILDTTRSLGTQPSSHSSANAAKTTPGARTTNKSVACEKSTPIGLLLRRESRPSADDRFCRDTIPRKRERLEGALWPLQIR